MQVYIFEYEIDGEIYEGRIKAKSFEQAEELIPFAKRIDQLVGEYNYDGLPLKILIPNREDK